MTKRYHKDIIKIFFGYFFAYLQDI